MFQTTRGAGLGTERPPDHESATRPFAFELTGLSKVYHRGKGIAVRAVDDLSLAVPVVLPGQRQPRDTVSHCFNYLSLSQKKPRSGVICSFFPRVVLSPPEKLWVSPSSRDPPSTPSSGTHAHPS